MADFRSVLNARLRMSTTAAIRDTAPLDRRARSTIVGSRPGGRLSTTNQPRSSSDLAAAVRPAPDIPVMITISVVSSASLGIPIPHHHGSIGAGSISLGSINLGHCLRVQGSDYARGQLRPYPRHRSDFRRADRGEFAYRTELLKQRRPPGRSEPGHIVKRAVDGRLPALGTVVRDGESVCLVPDPLQQVQSLTATRKDHRIFLAGEPDLLQALGQAADRHVGDAQFGER